MNPLEALQFLNDMASATLAPREAHLRAVEAVKVLHTFIMPPPPAPEVKDA